MKTAALVGLAGAVGTLCRYFAGVSTQKLGLSRLPYATFAVNVLGAFFIGYLIALAARHGWSERTQSIIVTGFLGGFTTYSAFAYETVTLMQTRSTIAALCYVIATVFIAGIACFGGMLLARATG